MKFTITFTITTRISYLVTSLLIYILPFYKQIKNILINIINLKFNKNDI
jgi:hypothetical protein